MSRVVVLIRMGKEVFSRCQFKKLREVRKKIMKLSGGEERKGKKQQVQRSIVEWVWQYRKRTSRPVWLDQREGGRVLSRR